jgi:hypothetical protein
MRLERNGLAASAWHRLWIGSIDLKIPFKTIDYNKINSVQQKCSTGPAEQMASVQHGATRTA